jgi:hypothetical protein
MSQCRDNSWQPTFVHDIDRPDGPYYVTEDLEFIKLRGNTGAEWTAHACELIRKHGVRDQRGFTTCEQYTNVQCGCQRGISEGNSACARFLSGR